MSFDDDVRDSGADGTREQRRAGLMAIAAKLGDDECAVLQIVAERLMTGQQRYGRFNLGTNRRDFHHESIEEVADALVYAACALLRGCA